MHYKNILITGGAGFVGSNLALRLKKDLPAARIVALDNLKRRGSEFNVSRLRDENVDFVHGDIRMPKDLATAGPSFDLILECSAEPSVLAGVDGNPSYVLQTNLTGTLNCLEVAREHGADFVFLSTSRVYPVRHLRNLNYVESGPRFELTDAQDVPGASQTGISEAFPLDGSRTLYGATKLASELVIAEYQETYGLRTLINRCGVITGPWQMGKVDQGVFALWLLAHHFNRPLSYIGYGGTGRQVRDLLHVDDLYDALAIQLDHLDDLQGETFNLGGGRPCSLSLRETTALCEEITGKTIEMSADPEERTGDIPIYLTDNSRLHDATGWKPAYDPEEVLADTYAWIQQHESSLQQIVGF
jgi:CDP-paratose 2-epimerase